MDCAELCQLAVRYMERNSRAAATVCAACAEVCELCQEECNKYQMDYCLACAAACRTCAEECRAIVAMAAAEYNPGHDSVIAGLRE
jgi:hypothetical protein